jgi:hypothetical protein
MTINSFCPDFIIALDLTFSCSLASEIQISSHAHVRERLETHASGSHATIRTDLSLHIHPGYIIRLPYRYAVSQRTISPLSRAEAPNISTYTLPMRPQAPCMFTVRPVSAQSLLSHAYGEEVRSKQAEPSPTPQASCAEVAAVCRRIKDFAISG